MYRVYMGNLDSEVTEATLLSLLDEHGLAATAVVIKRGYAFVDCPDQDSFERTIERLNGYNLMGSILQVEASSISKRMRSNCVLILNLPSDVATDNVVKLAANFGNVNKCDLGGDETDTYAQIEYESADQAREAVTRLNNQDYEGSILKVDFYDKDTGGMEGHRAALNVHESGYSSTTFPLRLLVHSEFIGAIIGRKGQTIRGITAACKTRVDVHGKENTGFVEKMISIYGLPEHCTETCRRIMEIMQSEATNLNRGEITLKILIDDRYCGRIIGREGRAIKKIREDTNTRITISNVQEMAAIYPDRVIAIRGTIESMSLVEAAISLKLRESLERDTYTSRRLSGSFVPPLKSSNQTAMMTSSLGGASFPHSTASVYRRSTEETSRSYPTFRQAPTRGLPHHLDQSSRSFGDHHVASVVETCHIGVPNIAVGAVIGAAGVNIKRIIRDSNAIVTVEPRRGDHSPAEERVVTIRGNSDACWRASYFIFEKMKMEGFAGADGEVRLRTTISVPHSAAGRVIGKGGKNVREIQRVSGALVKLPADMSRKQPSRSVDSPPPAETAAAEAAPAEETAPAAAAAALGASEDIVVEVVGNFISTQMAHQRIRSMIFRTPPPVHRRGGSHTAEGFAREHSDPGGE